MKAGRRHTVLDTKIKSLRDPAMQQGCDMAAPLDNDAGPNKRYIRLRLSPQHHP
jgi:hypothetical protein